jgi:hypothetical protein
LQAKSQASSNRSGTRQSRGRQAVDPAISEHAIRTQWLRDELLATVDCLQKRRADLIDERLVDAYVAVHWLEWNGGSLQLTETGKNMCRQMRTVTT